MRHTPASEASPSRRLRGRAQPHWASPARNTRALPVMLGFLLAALLLMAGLALVPEDLLKAASMDGANAWQRFWKITLPLIKPSILVALLFRTLDAFRIFDNIFVLTGGANDTSSVSMLAYNNLIRGLNLGIGSAMSVLIFLTTAIIAFIFIKAFGAAAPGQEERR